MNTRHNHMTRISTCRNVSHNMIVAQFLDTFISVPTISPDFSPHFHVTHNKIVKACRCHIRNNGHSYSTRATPPDFCRYGNNRLSLSTSTTDFRPAASNICFINFNSSGQLTSSRTNHCTAQFMEPNPCCIIAAKPENSFQSESVCSMLLARHKPHSKKPRSQRFMSLVKQRSRSYRCLPFTFSAEEETASHHRGCFRSISATGAAETFWPPKLGNVVEASVFATKPFIKLLECSRIICASNGMYSLFHDHMLHYVVG